MEEDLEYVKITDAGGDTIKYVRSKNEGVMLFPLFVKTNFDLIRDMRLRDDDVILCTWPRCGTHWMWEWMRLLQTGTTEVDDADKDVAMFELNCHGELDTMPSPRVLNSHLVYRLLPSEVTQKKLKTVLVYRNPKDACISWYMHHRDMPAYEYKGEFKNFVPMFLDGNIDWGAYSDYLREWERVIEQRPDLPIHVVSYEQMKKDPLKEITKLSKFLGKDYDVSFLQTVADACALDKMRKEKGNAWEHWKVQDSPNTIYRKGKVDGWKEWFTVAQNEEFDIKWARAMEGSKIFKFD